MTNMSIPFSLPRLTPQLALRMLGAGVAWGVLFASGFTALSYFDCGVICPEDVVVTGAISIAVGIVAIGPVAALRRA